MCKFSHMCVASYMRAHASKISMRVFVSAVCVTHVSHVCRLHVTRMSHASNTHGPFKLLVICTVCGYTSIIYVGGNILKYFNAI